MTQRRTLQETRTTLTPAEVLAAAKEFFTRRVSIYSAFPEQEGTSYATFRGQGGEEIAVGAVERDGATVVTVGTYMFDAQVSRFFATLPPAAEVTA